MSIEDAVLEKLRTLPPHQKQEVLDFADFLSAKSGKARPHRNLLGIWDGLGVHITEEDIDEARKEMWGNLTRDDI